MILALLGLLLVVLATFNWKGGDGQPIYGRRRDRATAFLCGLGLLLLFGYLSNFHSQAVTKVAPSTMAQEIPPGVPIVSTQPIVSDYPAAGISYHSNDDEAGNYEEEEETIPGDEDRDDCLDDGSYSAEAENDTAGNGPYSLDCDKSGSEVTINFDNGGYIVTDVNSEEYDGSAWIINTTHSDSGDDWTVTIYP